MRELPAQRLNRTYWEGMERKIKAVFWEEIFAPIDYILSTIDLIKWNAASPLEEAIKSYKVVYRDGVITGDMTAAVSKDIKKIGGQWSATLKGWILSEGQAPLWLRKLAREKAEEWLRLMDAIRAATSRSLLETANSYYDLDASKVAKKIYDGWRKAAKGLAIETKDSGEVKEEISRQYTDNLNLYIKKWAAEEINKIREVAEKHVREGKRPSELAEAIKKIKKVSDSKAAFLARNETGLFLSAFRSAKNQEVGIQTYRWRTMRDSRVRPDHQALEGRVFRYDSPPIIDTRTGDRGNPGQIYNCRCVDIPLLP